MTTCAPVMPATGTVKTVSAISTISAVSNWPPAGPARSGVLDCVAVPGQEAASAGSGARIVASGSTTSRQQLSSRATA